MPIPWQYDLGQVPLWASVFSSVEWEEWLNHLIGVWGGLNGITDMELL